MSLPNSRRNNNTGSTAADKLTKALLTVYLIALVWILVFKLGVRFSYAGGKRSINLIPFSQPVILNGKADAGEMILNAVIFIPLGVYTEILFGTWSFGKKLFVFFLSSLLIEMCQYIFGLGAFDITDIITNTAGGIVGLLLYKAIEKVFNNSNRAHKFVNAIAAAATVLMILFLLLLKMNMLPVRYQ